MPYDRPATRFRPTVAAASGPHRGTGPPVAHRGRRRPRLGAPVERAGRHVPETVARAARLAAPRRRSPWPRGDRARRAVPRDARVVASAVYAVTTALLFTVSGALPPRHAGHRAAHGCAQAARPRQHLLAHRGHLHAVRGAPAARRPAARAALARLVRRGRRACASGCSGWARRAGSTCRPTSPSAGWRCFFLPDFAAQRRRGRARALIAVGGGALHGRRHRLRARAAPTRSRAGSGSTRSSTRSPCSPTSCQYVAVSLVGLPAAASERAARLGARALGRGPWPTPAPSPCAGRRARRRRACPTSRTHQARASDARPRDAGVDEGVEHLPLGLAQPGHHRHGQAS